MGKRFLFGFTMFFALFGVLALDHFAGFTWGFFIMCVGMTLGGLRELARMFRLRGLPLDAGLLAWTAVLSLVYVQLIAEPPRLGALAELWNGDPDYLFEMPPGARDLTLAIPLLVAVLYPLIGLNARDVSNLGPRITNNLGVFLYLVYPVVLIMWIRIVPDTGAWLIYFLLVASRLGDVGAYLMGRAFGRHKLIPHLSAGKTVEGAVFGLAFSAAGGLLLTLWANWATGGGLQPLIVHPWHGAVLGLFVGIAAQAGDLVESAFKRAAGIKDSGNLVPSFGGIMDIMDNFMLTGPLLIVVLALWA